MRKSTPWGTFRPGPWSTPVNGGRERKPILEIVGGPIIGKTKSNVKVGLLEYCWTPSRSTPGGLITVLFSAEPHLFFARHFERKFLFSCGATPPPNPSQNPDLASCLSSTNQTSLELSDFWEGWGGQRGKKEKRKKGCAKTR